MCPIGWEIYEAEPWRVVGATMVVGGMLGIAFTWPAGGDLSQLQLTGDRETAFLLAGVVIPVVSQALMLAGPLFLYLFRDRFREPLDGLTFGAASALGFTLASSLTQYWPLLSGPVIGSGSAPGWARRLTPTGLPVALANPPTTPLLSTAPLPPPP